MGIQFFISFSLGQGIPSLGLGVIGQGSKGRINIQRGGIGSQIQGSRARGQMWGVGDQRWEVRYKNEGSYARAQRWMVTVQGWEVRGQRSEVKVQKWGDGNQIDKS